MDSCYEFNHASQPSRQGSEAANSYRPTPNASDEYKILRENIKELNRRHGVEQGKLQKYIARLEDKLTSEYLELSRDDPVPYGSSCSSGATPQLLDLYSEKVLIDLGNFVLFSIPSETPIEITNSLKARVSEVFFSKFERIDFGVKGESLFKTPGLLPEQSLTEFGAFLAYADDPEDEAVKPYRPKFERFLAFKQAKIQKTCGQMEFNDASSAHFRNLAMNVWMLHKLAFSFEWANVRLMRVVRDEPFIDKFMEPVGQQDGGQLKGKPPAATTTVKHVILPGLWINNSVIKCRVCLGSATGQEPSTSPATQLRGGGAMDGTGPRNVDVTPKQVHQPTSSGATPQLLDLYSEKVLIDLGNFVLFSIPSETPIEITNSLKARVSEVFFSKFERIDFGVKGESLFTTRDLLPEQSLTEFGAFLAYADDPEDEAVKPYMPKFERFLAFKQAKIQKTCGQVEFNDASSAHFRNLAMNVWMLHKLAFSFERANVRLMRVVRDEPFIDKFMEPVGQQDEGQLKGKPPAATTTVKHVILPGLWVNNSVIKCRVCLGSATGQEPSTAPATQLREGDAVSGTGPRSVDATQDKAHQPTSSQVPDRKAPAANAQAHQQTQATEDRRTDELHVSEASNSLLPDEMLRNDKTPAVEVDQAAPEMTNMDITNLPLEELGEEPPLQPPHRTIVTQNYYSTSSEDFAHHENRPNPDPLKSMEATITNETHISETSHSLLPDEELGNDKTAAVEVDQAAKEMKNMDITNLPLEELEEESPLQHPPTSVTENYYSTSTDFANHVNRPNPDPQSSYTRLMGYWVD